MRLSWYMCESVDLVILGFKVKNIIIYDVFQNVDETFSIETKVHPRCAKLKKNKKKTLHFM